MDRTARSWAVFTAAVVFLGVLAAFAPRAGVARAASTAGRAMPAATGPAMAVPKTPRASRPLATLGSGQRATEAAEQNAARMARKTGHPVTASSLTTGTTAVTAEPSGGFRLQEYTLPVRVRHGNGWVPVSTRLVRTAGGLSPAAVPGDTVTFSSGGSQALAAISASGTRLALQWPTALPAPVVSGSTATYRNVLPGVDLVVTALSAATGGFSEVLVVHDAAAARDPGLSRLALRVSTQGTQLRPAAGGGLTAPVTGQGSYQAPAPRMWDSAPSSKTRPGPSSSLAGPGRDAQTAPVTAAISGHGATLTLAPSTRLLRSPSTRFPVYIDPSFSWHQTYGYEQAFDPVQSDCPASHFDDKADYPDTPVGYNDFETPTQQCDVQSTDYSYYRESLPSVIAGSGVHLHTASLQAFEAYSSDCTSTAAVTLTWTGGISKGTGWANRPGATTENTDVTDSVGPDIQKNSSGTVTGESCNTTYVENDQVTVPAPFNVLTDLGHLRGKSSTFTFRLGEPGNTDDAEHKQFTDNPDLQITYNDTPAVPGALKATATSAGTASVGCDTSYKGSGSPPPPMGKSASVNGPFLWATYNDPDGDMVQSTVGYWQYSDPSDAGSVSAGPDLATGSTPVAAEVPASYTSGLANGTVIAWHADATDGVYTSAWSPTCYFSVYPHDPDPPAVTAGFDQTTAQTIGATLSFTITQSGTDSDPATRFIWGVDQPPPTTGTIPAAQTCTTAASSACVISGGQATVKVTVRSPGPHNLWVYEQDTAGNDSGMTNAAPAGMTSTFTGAGDPQTTFDNPSGSLQANFGDALTAGGNSMISNTSGASCGAGSGDGNGSEFSAASLTGAGWTAGRQVTVDGATFTVPGFGTCGADNVLAANQEIGTGSAGAQGSALVFLASSTGAYAQVPGLDSAVPDSGVLSDDNTAPSVPGGVPVTGAGCTDAVALDVAQSGCVPASGTVKYTSSCPESQQGFDLTVPDWEAGPADIAALTVPQVSTASGASATSAKIYAFAVPLDGSCTVSAVDLPDVGSTVSAQVAGSGSSTVTEAQPGLHIFGMAIRNTTTATPAAAGNPVSAPSGQAWTGAFASPVEDAFGPPSGRTWGNQTVRIGLSPTVSAPAGAKVRIRLSDPGFLSGDKTGPLQLGAATIAQAYYGAIPAQTPVTLTFGGSDAVTIPEGGDVYSDPLTLPFAVTAGKDVLVSLWLQNSSLPYLPENSWSSGALTWFAAAGSGSAQQAQDTTGTPFTGSGSYASGSTVLLTGLDVTTPATAASPGAPTMVVAGDNVIDGGSSGALSDAGDAPSERLAGQLASQQLAAGSGVVDAGIEANQVLADGTVTGGVSLLARLDRDVLSEPDVGTVIIDEGLEDLLRDGSGNASGSTDLAAGNLADAYQGLQTQLNAFGIQVILTTLTPCAGYADSSVGDSCSTGTGATVDASRLDANTAVSAPVAWNCWADLDAAVTNGSSPEGLAAADNAGDGVNLTLSGSGSGYTALAPAASDAATSPCIGPSTSPLPAVP